MGHFIVLKIIMKKRILIITMALDPHADAVIDEIRDLGFDVFRLNTENLLTEYKFKLYSTKNHWEIILEDSLGRKILIPDEVQSVYYRKPKPPKVDEKIRNNKAAVEFAESEAFELLKTIYASREIRWINDPFKIRREQIKYPQLQLAKECGLLTPDTIITNQPEEAMSFFSKHKDSGVITKSLITTTVNTGKEINHLYSHLLTEEEFISSYSNVRFAPTMFQKYIHKEVELRITVIGNTVFACEIDSQSSLKTIHDWRKESPFNIPHTLVELPQEINNSLLIFIQESGLSFGAIDMIKSRDGDYFFLENNPNGQWYWIEMITGSPMAKEMANLLINGH